MTVLRPYVVLGTGSAIAEDPTRAAVVLVHESEAEAEENERRLEQRLDEWIERDFFAEMSTMPGGMFEVDAYTGAEVEIDGRVVTVTLTGGTGQAFPLHQTPLFLHESR